MYLSDFQFPLHSKICSQLQKFSLAPTILKTFLFSFTIRRESVFSSFGAVFQTTRAQNFRILFNSMHSPFKYKYQFPCTCDINVSFSFSFFFLRVPNLIYVDLSLASSNSYSLNKNQLNGAILYSFWQVKVGGLVQNKGWTLEPVDYKDTSVPEEIRTRGFRINKIEQEERN